MTRGERIRLVYLEANDTAYRSDYIPDDCTECGACGQPQLGGGGMCSYCLRDREAIVRKADRIVVEAALRRTFAPGVI